MFGIGTDRGRYAVKLLNPEVMARPEAMGNFIRSEEIARWASVNQIPACAAVCVSGCPVVRCDGDWMIFPYIDGSCVQNEEITAGMAEKVGRILGKLHSLSDLPTEPENTMDCRSRWNRDDPFVREHSDTLIRWETSRIRKKYGKTVLSHRDLEPKNVMWQGNSPILIDWEAAGEINAAEDLFTTALCFAKSDSGISAERFKAFLTGYFSETDPADCRGVDWFAVSGCFFDLTDWLAYNLTRSRDGASEEERQIGREQVQWACDELDRFDKMQATVTEWIRGFTDPA